LSNIGKQAAKPARDSGQRAAGSGKRAGKPARDSGQRAAGSEVIQGQQDQTASVTTPDQFRGSEK